MISYRLTPWDSKSLGLKTAEYIDWENLDNIASIEDEILLLENILKNQKIDFIYTRVDSQNFAVKEALQNTGYYFAECSQMVIRTKIRSYDSIKCPKIGYRNYKKDDILELKSIAKESFSYGRFHEDPRLNIDLANLRYVNWIDDLIDQDADIKIATLGKKVIGFSIQKMDKTKKKAQLILAGCSKGKEIFASSLWNEILLYNKSIGVASIEALISASNIGVLNIYSFFGFKIKNTFFGFHKHLTCDNLS